MAKRYTREEIIARLKKTLAEGKPIVIGGAGNGFMAKLEEKGGIDIIGVYNSGRFRHMGAGSMCGLLPMGRNQDMVAGYVTEILSQVKGVPVIAGFCAQDPQTLWEYWFKQLADMGVSGFMSFPTVGGIDRNSTFRQQLEESGLGFDKEVEVLKLAHDLGYFTVGYCFTPEEAKMIAGIGVDILACHTGLTGGGMVGAAKTVMPLDASVEVTNKMIEAAKEVRPNHDFLPITHGGPMEDPKQQLTY